MARRGREIGAGRSLAGPTVGLLGGSFNPAHEGHLAISLAALKRLGLDQVWWLVSPQNPLKAASGMAALDRRLASARAMARHPRIHATGIETALGTRYTADTLRALKQRFCRTRFVWLMGADNLIQLPRWRDWQQIFHLVPVAVFDRPTYALGALAGQAARRFARARCAERSARGLARREPPAWVFLHTPLMPQSASKIRADSAEREGGQGEAVRPLR